MSSPLPRVVGRTGRILIAPTGRGEMGRLTFMRDQLFHLTGQILLAAQGTGRAADLEDVGQGLWRALGWGLLLTVAAVVAFLLAMWVRRQMVGGPRRAVLEGGGFSLADLRRMRDEGKMSKEEYELSRRRMVAAAQRTLADEAAAHGEDAPRPEQPRTKDVDLVKDAEA